MSRNSLKQHLVEDPITYDTTLRRDGLDLCVCLVKLIHPLVEKVGGSGTPQNDTISNTIMVHDIGPSGYGWCHEKMTPMWTITSFMWWVGDVIWGNYRHATHDHNTSVNHFQGVMLYSKGECD